MNERQYDESETVKMVDLIIDGKQKPFIDTAIAFQP